MSNMLALLAATGGGQPKLFSEDVFSAYTYTGNGSTQTIVNGIDLAGKGGMVWLKRRDGAFHHYLYDTSRGGAAPIYSALTNAAASVVPAMVTFNGEGFSLSTSDSTSNTAPYQYISWTFRNAKDVFQVLSATKSAGSNLVIDLSPYFPSSAVGMVKVKRTDATGSWYVWHRSLTSGKLLIGETTAAEATLGHITVSGTTLTLVNSVIADGTYHVEAYAHDTSADGLIQCGSFTTDASGNATVNLGWEPQYLLVKQSSAVGPHVIVDSARGLTVTGSVDPYLTAESSAAEATTGNLFGTQATGFSVAWAASQPYTFIAIRRPNKPPTSGTQVYNAIARTGTGAAATVTGVGFAPDLVIYKLRTTTSYARFADRLRGTSVLYPNATTAESAAGGELSSYGMSDIAIGTDPSINGNGSTYINHFFRRAPGFFDICCYTGTGVAHTEAHNLKAVPELMIVKARSAATGAPSWAVYAASLGASSIVYLNLINSASANTYFWNSTTPTEALFTIGTAGNVNESNQTYVAYLFASLVGISKIGSYTGNGSSQNIDCGFTTGSRFVLIKRTDTVGDWMLADSTRGIVAGSDPRLSLNTTAAEVTTDDWLDPYAAGFAVNQTAASNANVLNGTYIYLAIA